MLLVFFFKTEFKDFAIKVGKHIWKMTKMPL